MNQDITTIIKELLAALAHGVDDIVIVHDDDIDLDRLTVSFNDPSLLIGRDGDALRSLNYLVRKIAEKKLQTEDLPNFILDVNNYYGKKITEIKTKAKIVADRAVSFKRNIELEPMTAYDRLIVHAYLGKFKNIVTESAGEGPARHVVVKYKEILS